MTRARSLLYLELGSTSFKASLLPRDSAHRLATYPEPPRKKLNNLLSLDAYGKGRPDKSLVTGAAQWFAEIRGWAQSHPSPADEILVIATAAFRDMLVFEELDRLVEQAFSTRIRVLDGSIEAQLLLNGCGRQVTGEPGTALFDLGGGSLEMVCLEGGTTHFTSLQLGAGRVTVWVEEGRSLDQIDERILGEFRRKCQIIRTLSPTTWLGAGGSVREFTRVFEQSSPDSIRACDLAAESERLSRLLFGERERCLRRELIDVAGVSAYAPACLPEHRRRTYVGGILVLNSLCSYFDIKSVRVDEASVSSGVLSLLQLLGPTPLHAPEHGDPGRDPGGPACCGNERPAVHAVRHNGGQL